MRRGGVPSAYCVVCGVWLPCSFVVHGFGGHNGRVVEISSQVYKDGLLVSEDVGREALAEHLRDPEAVVLVDFVSPDRDDLDWVVRELKLHPIAVNDALEAHSRPKIERYDTHDFVVGYYIDLKQGHTEFTVHEVSLFVTAQALVSVRRTPAPYFGQLRARIAKHPELAGRGVYSLFWAMLDTIVDSHFDSVQDMDERLDELEDRVFADGVGNHDADLQRDLFWARKQLVQLRRLTLPMREMVNSLMRDEQSLISPYLRPYFADVYDHTLRVSEWVDSLRDLVTSLLDASLTIQGNRMNMIMKKVTSWAAIIAVPTLITGFFGQNVAFFGFGEASGLVISCALIAVSSVFLYWQFKRNDWL